jgi:hypothetical protein
MQPFITSRDGNKLFSNNTFEDAITLNYIPPTFDDLFIDRLGQNFLVNSNLAKLIFDDGEFHAMGLVIEDMVKKGCLTGPQETCCSRDGNKLISNNTFEDAITQNHIPPTC